MILAFGANRATAFIDVAAKFENGGRKSERSAGRGNAPNLEPADQYDLHVSELIEKSA